MAKKPKKDAKGDEAAAGAEAPVKAGKKKLFVMAGLAVLVLGGGAGAFTMLGGSHTGDEPQAEAKKPVSFVDLREMTVNLAAEPSQERQHFLKFRVALEVGDPKVMAEIQPLLPRVEDTFQVFLRELRASDLEGSAGTYRLREELLRRVNMAVYPAKVDAVLFKDIVVQ
jgi:flagellar protein FliL